MQIRIEGHANMRQAEAQFATLTAQVKALNAAMAETALIPQGGNPAGFAKTARGINAATAAYSQALASSGAFRVEQLKMNDIVNKNTQALQKQKLSFRDVWGKDGRRQMKAVYREQLAMNQAVHRSMSGAVSDGRLRTTMAIPTEVHKSWDTLNRKVGMFRYELASASGALVNWGKNTQWAGRQLMAGITMPVAAFGAAAGVMAYQVDKQMTRIQKVYDTTADANNTTAEGQMAVERELMKLREDAMVTGVEAARKYGSSITETLEVQAELAAVGQQGAALQKNTSEVMRISMLGEIDHATTTQALIAVQSILGATTKETADAFNYMNAIENATSLATADFAQAIPRALGPMKQMSAEGASVNDVLQNTSLLMVAMKERGIQAGEGANAIKAMMQRLYRPSKRVREEWQQIVGLDPAQLVEKSGGDIMKILPMISEAMADLSKPARIKALAGLFGTYQVTRMSAMLDGINNINDAHSQTARVLEVNAAGIEDWADIAEREQQRVAESAAGKFDRALQGLKAELALIGDPFLNVASVFLTVLSKGMELFNAMPEWAKKAVIFGAMFAAIAGPIIMLVGLFGNFIGMMGRFTAASLRLVTNFELLTKEQHAARAAAKLASAGFVEQTSAAAMLERQLKSLVLASQQSAIAMTTMAGIPLPHAFAAQARNLPPGVRAGVLKEGTGKGVDLGMPGGLASQRMPSGKRGHYATAVSAQRSAEYAERAAAADRARQRSQMAITKESAKTEKNLHGGAVATAAMAASMATMMFTSNETANDIANIVLVGSILVPAMKGLAPVLAKGATKAGALAKNISATATGAMAGQKGVKGLAAGAKAAALGFSAMMGPIGWTVAAVTAVAGGIWMWNNHLKKAREEQAKLHNDVNSLGDAWATEAGRARKEWKQVELAVVSAGNAAKQVTLVDQYSSGDLKGKVKAFKSDEFSDSDRDMFLKEHFMELQVEFGLTAKEASQNIRALLTVAGRGIEEQENAIDSLMKSVGTITQANIGEYLANQINILSNKEFKTEEWEMAGEHVGSAFLRGFHGEMLPGQGGELLGQLRGAVETEWIHLADVIRNDPKMAAAIEQMGLKTTDQLIRALRDAGSAQAFAQMIEDATGAGADLRQIDVWRRQFEDAVWAEGKIIQGIVEDTNTNIGKGLDDNLRTFEEFSQAWIIALNSMNFDEVRKSLKAMRQELDAGPPAMITDSFGWLAEQIDPKNLKSFELAVESMAKAHGIKKGITPLQTYENIMNNVKDETAAAANEASNIAKNVNRIPKSVRIGFSFTNADFKDILRDSMSSVQDRMSSSASDAFNNRMDSALSGAEAAWDRRLEAQQNKHENQVRAFESRWERRKDAVEKYYDTRINRVEKAIEAEEKAEEIRQRIFEAEKTRLQRLNEMANKGIDFNLAMQTGDLDEAAKIRNDMEATVSDWALSDAAAAGGSASQRKIERLGNRKDVLEDQRAKEMKALEKREDAERRHLERIQKMREDSLKRQSESEMDAMRQRWEADRSSLEGRLELFKSYTARNQKDLERWMKVVGLTYDDFGTEVKAKGDNWSKHFRVALKEEIRTAATQIASDRMWENMAGRIAKKTILGMGFGNAKQFGNFIRTGELPKNFGENKPAAPKTRMAADHYDYTVASRHTGGWADGSAGSRKGVARNLKGLHQNEMMVRAQKGEFFVNKRAAKENGPLLEAINSGAKIDRSRNNTSSGVGGGGIAQFAAALAYRGMAAGIATSLQNAFVKKHNEVAAASSGVYGAGKAGKYSDRSFNAEQLKNAAIIASVGSGMGMSARDIMIGIMTAITESGLVNVNYGDRDSLGLFQQRPSMGWGTPAQVTNPEYASRKFFEGLKGIGNRNNMAPWLAAQAVQRSFDPTGANYQQYWDNAQAIYNTGLKKSGSVFTALKDFVMGTGGWHKPSVAGKGWVNSHDYRNGLNSPLYAHADGKVVDSRAVTSGGSPGNGLYATPYRSYGETIAIRGKDGNVVRYAHLAPGQRYVRAGQSVKGGSLIGLSGNTGNSTGPHTHFDINGDYDARGWFAAHGIGLKQGGYTMTDGMANLHKDEVVVDPIRTRKLFEGIDNFANGVKNEYNVNVSVTEPGSSADEIANKVMAALKRKESRKPTRRTSK